MKLTLSIVRPCIPLLALAVAVPAMSDSTTRPAAAKGDCAPVPAGFVVHLDPATGRPARPTPEQARAFAHLQGATANRSAVGLAQERGPTGGVQVNLRGRYRSPLVAVKGSDGSLAIDHVPGVPAAGGDEGHE